MVGRPLPLPQTSILRQIVAGPRAQSAEAGLDLCYVTDDIIATSGPSSTFPQRAYRNPTDELVKFLDRKHGENWTIWEFRAEGTGYPDSEVYGRVRHYPWPDHHPPPFALIPNIMASMRNWLRGENESESEDKSNGNGKRVVVVHCKAGKGRSGTVACSYLISEEAWTAEDALARFTARRMRPGFGNGVSIPSQLRWVGYVDYWTKAGKMYVERQVEILEVHVWNMREGVKVSVEGYVDDGKKIKSFHTFTREERLIVDGTLPNDSFLAGLAGLTNERQAPLSTNTTQTPTTAAAAAPSPKLELIDGSNIPSQPEQSERQGNESGGKAVIFRPKNRIILPSSDVCIDFERRNRARYGWTLVTSVAHVWFNCYFEGLRNSAASSSSSSSTLPPSSPSSPPDTGAFEIEWEAMDGIKGSSQKGTRALDKLAVVWRAVAGGTQDGQAARVIREPAPGEPVPEAKAADWAGADGTAAGLTPDLGLRVETPESASVSKASSMRSVRRGEDGGEGEESEREREKRKEETVHGGDGEALVGVKSHGMEDDEEEGEEGKGGG